MKKKAMKATWDESEESDSDDEAKEEIANMCFMAIDNEISSLASSDEEDIDENLSYNELLNDFNDLHRNYEKLILRNNVLEKKIINLEKEIEKFLKKKKLNLHVMLVVF